MKFSRFYFATAIGLNLMAWSNPAKAQTMAPPPPAPSQRNDDALAGVSFSLDVSEEKSEAGVTVAGYFKKPSLEEMSDQKDRTVLGWKLGVEVPVGGSDDLLDGATLDKLGDGTKISGSITFLRYSVGPSQIGKPEFIDLMKQARVACESEAKTETERAACAYFGPDPDYILKHTPKRRLAMNRIMYEGFWTGGLKGSTSFKRYKWVSAGTLADNSASPSGYSATLWFAYYPDDAASVFKIEGEFSSAPEQADPEVICKTVIVTPKDDCVSAPPTAPVRKEAFVLRGEYRRYFPFGGGKGGIGAALNGSVDVLSGDYGFELPVYLSLPQTSAISPGIKFGYSSKKDDFGISFFLKTSFSF